jgi:hypothetical protein
MNASTCPATHLQAPSSSASGFLPTKEKASTKSTTPPATVHVEQSSSNRVPAVDSSLVPKESDKIITKSSTITEAGVLRSRKIEKARSISRNLVFAEEERDIIISNDPVSIEAAVRHDKIKEARALGDQRQQSRQLEQQQTATSTAIAFPMPAALEAKLVVSDKDITKLEEVIGAWVGAGVPASYLQRGNLDDDGKDDLDSKDNTLTGAAMADHEVLETLLAFLFTKGDEYHKAHGSIKDPTTATMAIADSY